VTERYFAFGANVNPATLRRRRIPVLSQAPARLDGHRLVFGTPGIPLFEPAFASLARAEDHVWGVLYDLSSRALGRLRTFEGSAYVEVGVSVLVGDESLEARTFVSAAPHRERRPSRRYLRLILDGAREQGLPGDWVSRLESQPSLYLPLVHEAWGAVFHVVDRLHRRLVEPTPRRG
jgi:hypothetical protein